MLGASFDTIEMVYKGDRFMVVRHATKRVFAFLAFIVMIATNAVANILPINNITTGEVSDELFNLFAPTGLTFAIWGVIYLLLLGYSIFQLKVEQDLSVRQNLMDDIAIFFIISSLANTAWIFAWHYGYYLLSLGLIVVVLISLILVNNEIKYGSLKGIDYVLIKTPFAIYFGWLSVATIANVTAYLVSIDFTGFAISESIWTIIILVVSLIIGVITMIHYQSIAYGLVFLWAYAGIIIRHAMDLNYEYPIIIYTTITCFVVYLITWGYVGYTLYSKNNFKPY
jgi:hypothetical protein